MAHMAHMTIVFHREPLAQGDLKCGLCGLLIHGRNEDPDDPEHPLLLFADEGRAMAALHWTCATLAMASGDITLSSAAPLDLTSPAGLGINDEDPPPPPRLGRDQPPSQHPL